MYSFDERVVMTLDAGGTNFVFSAIQGNKEIVPSLTFPAHSDNLEECLRTLLDGFRQIKQSLHIPPVAISFAFPGPADYTNGIIGDLPNFPSFRGGVALGPLLEETFNIPVYINNDGNLFAYGEALAGLLPEVNHRLEQSGNCKRYRNLLGITLGTGFGAGVVIDKVLLTGDNGTGGDVWLFRNKKYPEMIVEESVSIRAIKRVYEECSGESASTLTPKDIFDIAEGAKPGNREAAIRSFAELGEMAGDALTRALTLVDGLVVIGGGVSGAAKYILPALLQELRKEIRTFSGDTFPGMQMEVFNLNDPARFQEFLKEEGTVIQVPFMQKQVVYHPSKRVGIAISTLGTNRAVALGAYAFALHQLDKK